MLKVSVVLNFLLVSIIVILCIVNVKSSSPTQVIESEAKFQRGDYAYLKLDKSAPVLIMDSEYNSSKQSYVYEIKYQSGNPGWNIYEFELCKYDK